MASQQFGKKFFSAVFFARKKTQPWPLSDAPNTSLMSDTSWKVPSVARSRAKSRLLIQRIPALDKVMKEMKRLLKSNKQIINVEGSGSQAHLPQLVLNQQQLLASP